jgi:L-cystine transport system substrate-binding protein
MKKIYSLLAVFLVFALALTACSSANQNSNQSSSQNGQQAGGQNLLQKIKKAGVINIGTEGTYAPYTFHDKSGKLTGFDVELAQEVAKRMGVKPNFVETKWDGMFAGLNAQRFDMIANEVGIRPDRQQKYDFSTPYIFSKAALIVNQNNNTIKTFADLKGKKAAQSLTSNLADIAKKNGATIVRADGFTEAVSLLTSGRVDATVNEEYSFKAIKQEIPSTPIKIVAEQPAAGSGFLFNKGNKELVDAANKALDDMKKDGTYLRISKKYFGADVSK